MANVGGQAVLEGVMMRGPGVWAVACRTPSGTIEYVSRSIDSAQARHWVFRLPIIRGVVALGESLAIGFRALAISANYAAQEERKPGEEGSAENGDAPAEVDTDLWRVFQYHAAEHKAINAYEAGEPLEPEVVQRYSLIHPRCGTAFLLWVMVIGVFVFAFFGRPAWYWLIATRVLLLPVIAGLAYELIRYAGKHQGNRVLMTMLAQSFWLQRLTTREPSLDQIEVSIRALREVLDLEKNDPLERAGAPLVEVMA